MILPDQYLAIVRSAHFDGTVKFDTFAPLQPDEEGAVHVVLRRDNHSLIPGYRRCELVDGIWHDKGPAPSQRDDSWHPDLPEHLAAGVEICRRVLRDIPRGRYVQLFLKCGTASGGNFRVDSSAMFRQDHPTDPEMPGGIPNDNDLDRIPMVRFVERFGEQFGWFFSVEPHDDGSGVDKDLVVEVGHSNLVVSLDGCETGLKINLSSNLTPDGWQHKTNIAVPLYGDPVTKLREIKDPLLALQSAIAEHPTWSDFFGPEIVIKNATLNGNLDMEVELGTLLAPNS